MKKSKNYKFSRELFVCVICLYAVLKRMENKHRYFIQYMLRNGCVNSDKALAYCNKTNGGDTMTLIELQNMCRQINREISRQFFKIIIVQCEVTEQELFVWTNRKNDAVSKLQVSFTDIELEYFHAIFKEIIQSSYRKVTFIICINITSTLSGVFSRDSGQRVLTKWIQGGYFVKHGDYIHLGMRTILEFTSYLKSQCPHCFCTLCSEIVFTGKICTYCDKIFHSYCLEKYINIQLLCPNCKSDWCEISAFRNLPTSAEDSQLDESAYENDIDVSQSESSQPEPGPSGLSRHQMGTTNTSSDIDGEETASSDDESRPRPSRRKTRRK